MVIENYLAILFRNFQGYPSNICTDFDFDAHLDFSFSNAVWDIKNGTILILSENKEIKEAYLGFEKLNRDQIKAMYREEPPVYHELAFPETNKNVTHESSAHWVLMNYYERTKIPVIAHLTTMIRQGYVQNKTYLQLYFDLNEVDV